ncbi:unnamed protein product [Penicillium olsonii]|nr:unnamed protein product [Penicillium olsonii]CAG7930882.1 unnamed protein product [Penicillium olsonii]
MEFTSTSGGFRSRRSYPNLNHVSLAPLTPRFPIDDDTEADYFNHHDNESYLSSISVPSTPPILSHSRSNSRTRHHTRSKSSTLAPLSDTNLQSRHLSHPLHHRKPNSISVAPARPRPPTISTPKSKSDAEWMLRAGIALASSTREEKGQSWLHKRESSTSLVSEHFDEPRHHRRTKSGPSRKARSGASTPFRSRAASRRGSRAGLAMTTLPTGTSSSPAERFSTGTGASSPERGGALVPDFVDERIRAEMATLGGLDGDWEGSESGTESEDSDEMPDFDEADLQQLTRERGFGLGSWIDRLVEWTLFGVDDWSVVPPAGSGGSRIGSADTTTTVTFEEPVEWDRDVDTLSLVEEVDSDGSVSHDEISSDEAPEKPGVQGGWEDAGWLFRVVKRALV